MFVPLRIHSVFSKGKGGLTLGEAASWVSRKTASAAALADIENLYGWAKWKRAAEAHGFTPLFGCEVDVGEKRFIFLVKSREGYGNLMEILNRKEKRVGERGVETTEGKTGAVVESQEARARKQGQILGAASEAGAVTGVKISARPEAKTEGLVVIFIPKPEDRDLPEELRERGVNHSSNGSGEGDFYIGGDFFNFKRALDWSRASNLPLVWANALKFITAPDRLILLHAIEKKIPYPPEKNKLAATVKLFGPNQEALALRKFGAEAGEAFQRTFEVAGKCRFAFADIVPPLPADIFPTNLRDLVTARLQAARNLTWRERERARRELDVIERSGFAPYFLIVHDVIEFSRRHRILHNLKGSGASSFLAYLLGISHISPIEFDLYFERFLNSGRNDPPDIDLDFDSRRRDEVLSYVLTKYGKGKTGAAFVCSLKNFRARSALYETARAFGLPPEEARSLSKRIPLFAEPDFLRRDKPAAGHLEIWKLAAELGGVYCEKSLHVGGVILTPAPAERYLPLEESAKGFVMSHFDRDAVEDLKLIKLDLLSVRGLAAISETRQRLNLRTIPPQDAKVFSLFREARTIGCFQVESPAMMNLLRRMKPANIYELTQALALIRPGPTESGMKEALLRSREGRPVARDPFMERILPETGGLLLYEEQVMQVAERVAGMPPEEGDLLRRTLKKTKKGAPSPLKEKFFREARERGYSAGEVERLWQTMEKFSSYSFNKAHSASYAAMAYQAVYLKAHHTVPYLTAVLNAGGGYYGVEEYIEEAKRCGIRILPPDANRSGFEFEVECGDIRVGLASIKGLGVKTIERIIKERGSGGEYLSVEDFLGRVKPGKAELLLLIRAGVFDSLEPRRTRQVLRYFQGIEDMEEVADMDPREKARMILDSLGFSPGEDALALYEGKRPDLRIRDLKRLAGTQVELVVRVVDARQKGTTNGRKYFYLFEDETGLLEGVGETRCLSFGSPPVCCLRGEVRRDGAGVVKVFNCSFLRSF